jgi:hypothetical protein
MTVLLPTIHVPAFSFSMDSTLLFDLVFNPDVNPRLVANPAMLIAAAPDMPEFDLTRPRRRIFYNYVIGRYKSQGAAFRGIVMRVGAYDEERKKAVDKKTWQLETRLGVKHLQLIGPDLDMLFSGVLMNDPREGLFVSPSSGTWAKRKDAILDTAGLTDESERTRMGAWLDLVNVMFTRRVLGVLDQKGGLPGKPVETRVGDVVFRSQVLPGIFAVHRFHEADECVRSYAARVKGGDDAFNERCLMNIPKLVSFRKDT